MIPKRIKRSRVFIFLWSLDIKTVYFQHLEGFKERKELFP